MSQNEPKQNREELAGGSRKDAAAAGRPAGRKPGRAAGGRAAGRAAGIMLRYNPAQRRRLYEFLFVLVLAVFSDHFDVSWYPPVNGLSSYFYISLIMAWALSVYRRISYVTVRRLLITASGFLVTLFLLRLCRYLYFSHSRLADEYIRYAYYIPQIFVSLLFYLTALCIGLTDDDRPLRKKNWLFAAAGLFSVLLLLNPLHGLVLKIRDLATEDLSHGPLYMAVVVWIAGFGLAGFLVLIRRCRISAVKRLWYIPAFFIVFCTSLLAIYMAVGGAPTIGGIKLYNFQEVFSLLFISVFESAIQIGLIPSNSAYEMLFRQSSIRAALLDEQGRPALTSADYLLGEITEDGGELREQQRKIHGGSIIWKEDLSAIRRLNEEIASATEELEGENDLIRQENAIREERLTYEMKNRLYDRIAEEVRSQTTEIDRMLAEEEAHPGDEDAFRGRLKYSMVLGAYVKRMGNLMVLSDRQKEIPAEELGLSLAESLDQIRLAGKNTDLIQSGEAMLPSGLLLAAYRLFEEAVEKNWESFRTLLVTMRAEKGFSMTLALDCAEAPVLSGFPGKDGSGKGSLSVSREDDTWYITLYAGEEEGR